MRKVIDYAELCRYDKAFRYVADVVVYSDTFALGNKGDRLRLVVSDYGFNRLLKDSMDGLIDIEAGSLIVQAFNYPDITDEAIDKDIKRKKAMLIEAFKTGKPLPEKIRRMIHEADTI